MPDQIAEDIAENSTLSPEFLWKLPQSVARKLAHQVGHLWQEPNDFGRAQRAHCLRMCRGGTDLRIVDRNSKNMIEILVLPITRRLEGTPMRGAKQQSEGEDNGIDNGKALVLPCTSPLHAIPGFERISHRKIYPKGSVLFVEGHAARGVYVVCAGRAKLSMTSAAGRKLIVRIARPGDLLGTHSALTGDSYEATAETLAPCRIDFISRKDLLGLLDRQKSFGLALAVAISKEFTEFVEHTRVLLLSVSASEKLARLLLRLAEEFGERTTSGIRLQTLLTHEEIAQMIGVSRETVTRSLNMLKRKRIIRANSADLLIHNRAALAALAHPVA